VNGQYYCDVLLSHRCFQQSSVSQNVVYSQKQYVAYGEIYVIFRVLVFSKVR